MTDTPLKRALPPLHPGALLREDILPSLSISVSSFAAHLRVSRQMLHRILSEEAPVTPAMALRLGKLCGNGPELWLNLQARYDLDRYGRELAEELNEIPTLNAA